MLRQLLRYLDTRGSLENLNYETLLGSDLAFYQRADPLRLAPRKALHQQRQQQQQRAASQKGGLGTERYYLNRRNARGRSRRAKVVRLSRSVLRPCVAAAAEQGAAPMEIIPVIAKPDGSAQQQDQAANQPAEVSKPSAIRHGMTRCCWVAVTAIVASCQCPCCLHTGDRCSSYCNSASFLVITSLSVLRILPN